jgi:hypothetical protein
MRILSSKCSVMMNREQMVLYNDGESSAKVAASAPAGRTNKASFQKDKSTTDRQIRSIATSKKSRMSKANAGRQPVDFVQGLTSGGMFGSSMFGSAAEIVGGSGSAGTGIGAALLGGGVWKRLGQDDREQSIR